MKSSVPQIIYFLDDMEQKGVFNMMSVLIDVTKKIGERYSTEDIRQIGDGIVELVGILKKLTSPEALSLLSNAADIPAKVDLSKATPAGPASMFFRLGNPEIKQGMGVLLELSKGLATLKETARDNQ